MWGVEQGLEAEFPYVYADSQFPHLLVGKRVVVNGRISLTKTVTQRFHSFSSSSIAPRPGKGYCFGIPQGNEPLRQLGAQYRLWWKSWVSQGRLGNSYSAKWHRRKLSALFRSGPLEEEETLEMERRPSISSHGANCTLRCPGHTGEGGGGGKRTGGGGHRGATNVPAFCV